MVSHLLCMLLGRLLLIHLSDAMKARNKGLFKGSCCSPGIGKVALLQAMLINPSSEGPPEKDISM